jgi:hypothetical protein
MVKESCMPSETAISIMAEIIVPKREKNNNQDFVRIGNPS